MLGSINTGGFSKSQVDAMKASNYFQRKGIPGIYNAPNPTAKRDTGDFLSSYVKDNVFPGMEKDKKGDTFTSIAREKGSTVAKLKELNKVDPKKLQIGSKVKLR